jgi:HPt (histidine-containing phosphotransfer) domain-containing protein
MTTPATFDPAALREAFEHDLEFIRQLLALMIRDLPRYDQTLAAAAESGDVALVARMAHAVRGAVGHVHATGLCEIAAALEQAGQSRDAGRIADLRPGFHAAVAAIVDELSAWTRAGEPSAAPTPGGEDLGSFPRADR